MDINDLLPAVVTILIIGIVLGLGLFIMSEVRTNVATDYTGSDTLLNLTDEAPSTTLSDASKDDYTLSAVTVVNVTGDTISSDYYSFTDAGVITWEEALYNGSTDYYDAGTKDVNVTSTYTYDATDSPEEGINEALDGLANFSGWIAVIVVVLAAAIVLGIVLRSFGEGARV